MKSSFINKYVRSKCFYRKNVITMLYVLVLTSILFVINLAINILLKANFIDSLLLNALLCSSIIIFLNTPLKKYIEEAMNKIFFKERINITNELNLYDSIINSTLDLNEICDALIKAIVAIIKPEKLYIILEKENIYSIFEATHYVEDMENLQFDEENKIIQWFKIHNGFLSIKQIKSDEGFKLLSDEERDKIIKLDTELIIPIKTQNEVDGLILLTKKENEKEYTVDDINILFNIVNKASAALVNSQIYEKARNEAITDELTKLFNHRYFHNEMDKIVKNREFDSFSVAIIDVDHFKLYNDLYGHFSGDRALKKIAQILKKYVRRDDILTRYGGEEFAVIFPNLKDKEAFSAIERLRKGVEKDFIASSKDSKFLSISIGLAIFPQDADTKEKVLKYADKALYEAKKRGKNQCVVYSSLLNKPNDEEQDKIQLMQDEIEMTYFSAIYALAAAIDAKDHYTYGHSENVAKYAELLAEEAGFDKGKIEIIKDAGLLHDIGKIGIPESILVKTSSLTYEEYTIMKQHVDLSITIIKHIPNLIKVVPAIMSHHEKYDGTGYPRAIKGESIPIEARCLSIVDAFDAMTSQRPYRAALTVDEAVSEIEKFKGKQFDPHLTEIFINRVIPKISKEFKLNINPKVQLEI